MDLLYHRYASPFIYLQDLLDMGKLVEGLLTTIEKDNDCKLWEMYLHSFADVSFEDWKKKATSTSKSVELSQKEVVKEVNKSNEILKTFRIERG